MNPISRSARILKAALATNPIYKNKMELNSDGTTQQNSPVLETSSESFIADMNIVPIDAIDIINTEILFVDSEVQVITLYDSGQQNKQSSEQDEEQGNQQEDQSNEQDEEQGNREEQQINQQEVLEGEQRGKKRVRTNQANARKLLKQKGEAYISKTKKSIAARKMRNIPCSERCQNSCRSKYNEEMRRSIFTQYWDLTEPEKRNFLLSSMEANKKARSYVQGQSRRSRSFKYFLPYKESKTAVCKQFLLNTLSLSHRILSYSYDNRSDLQTAKSDQRGRKAPPNKTPEASVVHVKKFIESLPTVPSHYCRSDSNKLYLPLEFKSKSNVYRIYKNDFCRKEAITPVSEKVFIEIFNSQYNIGIHTPKKDKCVICEGSKECDVKSELYVTHIHEKELSLSLFKAHQIRSKRDPEFVCTSFDLQKVLNTPHGDNMLLYYSRKYAMYNFTFYESGSRNGYCYLWGESDGKRGANEICSNVFAYLNDLEIRRQDAKIISLFCDSCPGQNKNRQMLAMLEYFVQHSKSIKEVNITYLLPGHTYMPADSMHSVIESNYRKKIIWAPSEWPTIITNSRINPRPYEVKVCTHKDFQDWKGFQERVLSKPCQIRSVRRAVIKKGEANLSLFFAYDESEPPRDVHVNRETRRSTNSKIKTIYTSQLPVSNQKKKDLVGLCKKGIIPSRYHHEFLNLLTSKDVVDTLESEDEELSDG